MTGKDMEKICHWIQVIGVTGFVVLLMFCFYGKEDSYLEKMAFYGMAAGIVVYIVCLIISPGLKSTGVLFILLGVLAVGISAFLISKGYGSKEIEDMGTYSFRAEKYWQEEHTRRIRHRTTKSHTNYVEYQGKLDNGDIAAYKKTTSSIGDAMELVKKGDVIQRQVFLYNDVYFTDKPGTGEKEFLSDFFKWKTKLYIAAGIYALLGAVCIFAANRITLYAEGEMNVPL